MRCSTAPSSSTPSDWSLKDQLAAVSASLPTLDARTVREALAAASAAARFGPARPSGWIPWIEAFLELVARLVLGDDGAPSFAGWPSSMPASRAPRSRPIRAAVQRSSPTPELLDPFEKDRSFKKAEIADLRTSYALADLTRGDFSVVRMVKDEFDVRRPEEIRLLTKPAEREWVELIERKHAARAITLPLSFGEAAPEEVRLPGSPALCPGCCSASSARRFRLPRSRAGSSGPCVTAIRPVSATPGVRASDRPPPRARPAADVGGRVPSDDGIAPSSAAGEDEQFRTELKAVQRVFKLAPTFEATDALLADGVHSAQMVYRMGESEFVRRYGSRARVLGRRRPPTWSRAADTHAAVLTMIGDLEAFDSGACPAC